MTSEITSLFSNTPPVSDFLLEDETVLFVGSVPFMITNLLLLMVCGIGSGADNSSSDYSHLLSETEPDSCQQTQELVIASYSMIYIKLNG